MKSCILTRLLSASFLLAVIAAPMFCAPIYSVDFRRSQAENSVAYTGNSDNWHSVICGTTANFGGYAYCGAQLAGDYLVDTRGALIAPSLPFLGGGGYRFNILNAQNDITGILSIFASSGCIPSGGGDIVTCGVGLQLITSLNGEALSNSLVSTFSNFTVSGSGVATGASQTAFTLSWSNDRVDNVNFQIESQAIPEPSTLLLAATALIPLWRFRRHTRRG